MNGMDDLLGALYLPLVIIVGGYFVLALDTHVARNNKDLFFAIFSLSLAIIIADFGDKVFSQLDFYTVERVILNVLCLSLRPIIALLLIRLVIKQSKAYLFLSSLAVLNVILSSTAFANGFVFMIDETNTLVYGPFGFFSTALTALYLVILVIFSFRRFNSKRSHSGIIVIYSAAVVLIAAVISMKDPSFSTVANSVIPVAALLYYFYMHIHYVNKTFMEQEERMQLQQVALHVSQLQPHFLYNTLNTIYFLCEKDPEKAQEAISRFSDYLRQNLDSLTKYELIPFSEELEHTDTYLWIEQLRFDDRLEVVYDVQCLDFKLPVLTLQPIVENAVKHGICARENGGCVTISSREYGDRYEITIADNGVGFDTSAAPDTSMTHNGIKNVEGRLKGMCSGSLEITSVPGEGTQAVIKIPKPGETRKIKLR